MKRSLILTTIAVFLVGIGVSEAYLTTSTNYDALLYFGNGGFGQDFGTKRVLGGIGQNVIGEVQDAYVINYGIFYLNTSQVLSAAAQIFVVNIEKYGMEWCTFNWT